MNTISKMIESFASKKQRKSANPISELADLKYEEIRTSLKKYVA